MSARVVDRLIEGVYLLVLGDLILPLNPDCSALLEI
jgi:hypothetical protein